VTGTGPSAGDATLLLVRHGESVGNVAAARAAAEDADELRLATRDADTPLSERGVGQAEALGRALARYALDAVWCSPYVRALQTAGAALDAAGLTLPVRVDERLRDRELGILDRLTAAGVQRRYPAEDARRAELGKLYYRPPGGESWADVALRLRSWLADVAPFAPGSTTLVVTHDAVISLVRYVLMPVSESELLQEAGQFIRNASITTLASGADGWRLVDLDDVRHLEATGEPVTEHPGTDARGD
jgi:2,3-bisphosphoglycerate-dependent phosphoglycerate mutase